MMMGDPNLKEYLQEIREYPILKAKEEKRLFKLCIEDCDQKARENLITSNLRLVVSIAKKYVNCGLPFIDLIEEGNVGLIYAVERFDPSKGCRFSTYATCWIKHSICRAITEKNQLVRIPAYMKKIISQCKEQIAQMIRESGKTPTIQEVVERTNLKKTKKSIIHEALMTTQALESMQSLYTLNANQDWIEDRKTGNTLQQIFDKSEFEWIMQIIDNLDSKRAQVIKLRYGLNGKSPMTLKEIAVVLKLTKERIRQIEKETLSMLRQTIKRRKAANCAI
ncbi:RNA polymerase sigma factor RpoD/SigA [Candidatus Uabimicrobium sp. HlEnr_7]|uniref:sigma-70 family RNA polymerase sigma factor n=1 Tax=Candidatus Uabimicrobium helgolandensis TaxID=3095367 RepID=UPI003557EDB6